MYETTVPYNPDVAMNQNCCVSSSTHVQQDAERRNFNPLAATTEKLAYMLKENLELLLRLYTSMCGNIDFKVPCLDAPIDRSTIVSDIEADLQVAVGTNEIIRTLFERLGIEL